MSLPFILIGAFGGIIVAIFIIKAYNTDNKLKSDYDERQEAIRGRGYKYASLTAWILLGLLACFKIAEINLHMEDALVAFLIIAISLLVQTIHAVFNDAYFGNNNNRQKYIIFFIFIAIINIALSIVKYCGGELIVDGTITWNGISGVCGLMFVILGAALGIKNIISKKEETEEE